MKKISTILILLLFLFNCNSNDNLKDDEKLTVPTSIYGKWNWTKTTTGSFGSIILPSASNTHFYTFNEDGTFERVQTENNIVSSHNGTFVVKDEHFMYGNEDGIILKFIELSYSSNVWFNNCNFIESNQQVLYLQSTPILKNDLPGACHSDMSEYVKEE